MTTKAFGTRALLLSLALLTGCVTPGYWYHAEKTQDEVNLDIAQVKAEAYKHGYAENDWGPGTVMRMNEIIKAEMAARGYTFIKETPARNTATSQSGTRPQ